SWEGVSLIGEEVVQTENGVRSFMTYGGTKAFIVVQEPASKPQGTVAVSVEGDPVDLGFTVAAITEKSISWESNGVSFFIASDMLTQDELIEVASSMKPEETK